MTPIEQLHEAVQRYAVEVNGEDSGFVSSFVIGYEQTSFTDEEGMDARVTAVDYATGPGTTLATAIGLHAITGRYLDDAIGGGE